MNPSELLRIVDAIHREKNIDKEIVFQGIEAALVSAAKKHYGEEEDIDLRINREDLGAKPAFQYHQWLRQSLQRNQPTPYMRTIGSVKALPLPNLWSEVKRK